MAGLRVVDLFAGTGAFSYVLANNNFECVYANDMDENSKAIYKLNHPDTKFKLKDLNDIDVSKIPAHDVLCGGFPCQPFSIAGEQKGFEDPRSNVFWKILEILRYHKPSVVILENVKNLTSHDEGKTFTIITNKLKEAGYHIKSQVLDTCKITDVPQHRERIYIVCFRDPNSCKRFNFDFPVVRNRPIRDMLEPIVDDKYYYTDRLKVYDTIKEGVTKHINDNVLYQYRRYYVRENQNGVCPTLTANAGGGGHNVPLLLDDHGIRKLTPRECFNLQGFPADYKLPDLSDSALYKLAGNAVSVPVVMLIAQKLKKALKI